MHPNFGGFMNDQTAQMGFQVGKSAVMAGQEYMEQNVREHMASTCLATRSGALGACQLDTTY